MLYLADALQLYFTDLDHGLDVGVMGNIAHDFLRLWPEAGLKCFDGVELKLADG